jgi:hypothetical protein
MMRESNGLKIPVSAVRFRPWAPDFPRKRQDRESVVFAASAGCAGAGDSWVKALAAAALLVAGCAIPTTVEDAVAERVTSGEAVGVEIDPAFTDEERAELVACFEDWRAFSGGSVNVQPADDAAFRLVRGVGPSGSPIFLSYRQRAGYLEPGFLRERGLSVRAGCLRVVGYAANGPEHDGRGVLGPFMTETFTDADRETWARK